jgi:hypothetical protein
VDVTPFVGQRVTIQGERVPGIDPFAFFVRQIQSAPAVGGGTLPNTGGPSLLVPIIASILGAASSWGLQCCDAAGKNSKPSHLSRGPGDTPALYNALSTFEFPRISKLSAAR